MPEPECSSPDSTPASSAWLSRWNQLDLAIVLLSVMGITLEEIEINAALPINPTIIRIMRVLRIARGEGRGKGTARGRMGLPIAWGEGKSMQEWGGERQEAFTASPLVNTPPAHSLPHPPCSCTHPCFLIVPLSVWQSQVVTEGTGYCSTGFLAFLQHHVCDLVLSTFSQKSPLIRRSFLWFFQNPPASVLAWCLLLFCPPPPCCLHVPKRDGMHRNWAGDTRVLFRQRGWERYGRSCHF
jgi:hypothetical protein